MTIKVVAFNGPPGSGKDTCVNLLPNMLATGSTVYRVHHAKFAGPLKLASHALFGLGAADINLFEAAKEQGNALLHGETPRKLYQKLSGNFAKVHYGQDFFGRVMCTIIDSIKVVSDGDTLIAISDAGFAAELAAVAEHVGPENMYVFNVMREGATFEGDTRSYIGENDLPSGVHGSELDNNVSLQKLQDMLLFTLRFWL
jgi:hypothetical protein